MNAAQCSNAITSLFKWENLETYDLMYSSLITTMSDDSIQIIIGSQDQNSKAVQRCFIFALLPQGIRLPERTLSHSNNGAKRTGFIDYTQSGRFILARYIESIYNVKDYRHHLNKLISNPAWVNETRAAQEKEILNLALTRHIGSTIEKRRCAIL